MTATKKGLIKLNRCHIVNKVSVMQCRHLTWCMYCMYDMCLYNKKWCTHNFNGKQLSVMVRTWHSYTICLYRTCCIKHTLCVISLCSILSQHFISAFYLSILYRGIKKTGKGIFNEHIRDAKHKTDNTPLGDHVKWKHPNSTITSTSFKTSMKRLCKDVADLKVAESIEIRNQRPSLNIQVSSWPLLDPPPYTPPVDARAS